MRLAVFYPLSSGFWSLGNCQNYSTSGPISVVPDSVPLSLRQAWCTSQNNVCPEICDGSASQLSCNAETLKYVCVCDNGLHPNISSYKGTLPYYICEQWRVDCVKAHPHDAQGQEACLAVTCGSKNASQPVSSSRPGSSESSSGGGGASRTMSTPPGSSTPTGDTSSGTSSSSTQQSGVLSTAAKAGIGVGVGIATLIAFVISLLVLRNRRTRKEAERARATGGIPVIVKSSPWPSLRRLWRSEASGQHDRPELEGSSGRRELAGSQRPVSGTGQIAELSAEQRIPESNDEPKDVAVNSKEQPAEMSVEPASPREPHEVPSDAPAERMEEPDIVSEWTQSNPPPIPYASKPRPP